MKKVVRGYCFLLARPFCLGVPGQDISNWIPWSWKNLRLWSSNTPPPSYWKILFSFQNWVRWETSMGSTLSVINGPSPKHICSVQKVLGRAINGSSSFFLFWLLQGKFTTKEVSQLTIIVSLSWYPSPSYLRSRFLQLQWLELRQVAAPSVSLVAVTWCYFFDSCCTDLDDLRKTQ